METRLDKHNLSVSKIITSNAGQKASVKKALHNFDLHQLEASKRERCHHTCTAKLKENCHNISIS